MSNTNTDNSCGVFTVYPLGVTCVTTDTTNGSNGTMEIFITGGTSPYNIEWSTGSNNVTQITNMVPGTYTATVTDFYGDFTDVASCVIGAVAPAISPSPSPTPSPTPAPSYPSNMCLTKNQTPYTQYEFGYQGVINSRPSWSGTTYDVVYNSGRTRWELSGYTGATLVQNSNVSIPNGTWTELGTSNTWTMNTGTCVTVGLNAEIVTTDETCVNQSNGTITVTAWGGVGPIVYSIDGLTYQSSNRFLNLPPGNGTVYIKDANSNVITRNFTVGVGSNQTTYTLQLTTSTSVNSNAQYNKSKTVNWTATVTPQLPSGVSLSADIQINNSFTNYYFGSQNAEFTSGSTVTSSGNASFTVGADYNNIRGGFRRCGGELVTPIASGGYRYSGFSKTVSVTFTGGTNGSVSGVDTFTVSNDVPLTATCPVYGFNNYSSSVQNVVINGITCGVATSTGGTNQSVTTSPFQQT